MPLTIAELTETKVDGAGAFDVLMQAAKAHLEQEFRSGRLKGPEYSTVYLGTVNLAMQTGLQFLLQKDKTDLERQLLEKQIELANVEVTKAQQELLILQQQVLKVPAEIALLEAQTAHTTAQTGHVGSQKLQTEQQTTNLAAEALNIPKQGLVLDGQKCKLDAEFTLLTAQVTKTNEEVNLLTQKTATERAQTQAVGVDADSIIGKQKALYQSQADGFLRDAEQKAAKLLADTWSVRRTTDEATAANATNLLDDTAVGRAITKLLAGVGA